MDLLKFCIDTTKDFPLKKYYVLGIVTKGQINKQILDDINNKSAKCVVYFGMRDG